MVRLFLWHSGLLLILVIVNLFNAANAESTKSYSLLANVGRWIHIQDSLILNCQNNITSSSNSIQWIIDGQPVNTTNNNLITHQSDTEDITEDKTILKIEKSLLIGKFGEKSQYLVECSKPTSFGRSYGFIYIVTDFDEIKNEIFKPILIPDKSHLKIVHNNNDDIELTCQSPEDISSDNIEIHWLENGVNSKDFENSNVLILRNIEKHFMTVGCLLVSQGMKLNYKEIFLSLVEEFPVLMNSNFELDCSGSKWINDEDKNQIVSNSKLTLLNVTNDQSWTCYNDSFINMKSIRIKVIEKTHILDFKDQNIPFNETLSLECNVKVDQYLINSTQIQWFKDGNILKFGRILNITNVNLNDEGNYSCVATTKLDQASKFVKINVIKAPVIGNFPEFLKVLEGQTLAIACESKGIPEPIISWYNWNDEIVNSGNGKSSILKLENVTKSDEGSYSCVAKNDFSSDTKSLILKVFQPSYTTVDNKIISANAGSQVVMNCSGNVDSRLNIDRTWTKVGDNDSTSLNHFVVGDQLKIPYLRTDNQGTYHCKISTELDQVLVITKLEVISEIPKIKILSKKSEIGIITSQDLEIECIIEKGIPAPDILWQKNFASDDGKQKIINNNKLILNRSKLSDEGNYTCLGVNEYGRNEQTIEIKVYTASRIIKGPNNMPIESGSDVTFECNYELDPRLSVKSVKWLRNDNDYHPENAKVNNPTNLKLFDVTKEDQGMYRCTVETEYDSVSKTGRLTVLSEGPTFLSTEKDLRALEGHNITINCQANGLPIPKMSWIKNGKNILSGNRHYISPLGDLNITKLELSDQGVYECIASNIYGSISTTTKVEVIKRSIIQDVSSEKIKDVVKKIGDSATFNCDVIYDHRIMNETKVDWLMNLRRIRIDHNKYHLSTPERSLIIKNLDLSDRGKYECSVKTPFETISAKTNLMISGEAPKIHNDFKKMELYEGEDLKLTCLVSGIPRPTLTWLFKDAPLTHGNIGEKATASKSFRESRVIVKNITKEEEGLYQCQADNEYGSGVAKYSQVNVIKRTKVEIMTSGNRELPVEAGKNLKIPCHFKSDSLNQIMNVQWKKDSKLFDPKPEDKIDFGFDGSISIFNVQKRHEGNYECLVTTMKDNSSDSVDVKVIVNAPVITTFSGSQIIFNGDTVRLFCNANGIPAPNIFWTFNNTKINPPKNNEYVISHAIASDAGNYVCIARNEYGETRKEIQVRVVVLPEFSPELAVDEGKDINIPCIYPNQTSGIFIEWVTPNGLKTHSKSSMLKVSNVTSKDVGVYKCVISLSGGRSRTISTQIKITPELIVTRKNTYVEINAGENLTLECNILPGIHAKRLWKHESDIIIHGGNKEVSNKGSLMTIENIDDIKDGGTYECIAIADFGQDSIKYNVDVIPPPKVNLPPVSCSDMHEPIIYENLFKSGNDSAILQWRLPSVFNASCYKSITLVWWTNDSESRYVNKEFGLEDKTSGEAIFNSLKSGNIAYYFQMNLMRYDGSHKDGETESFTLDNLPLESKGNSPLSGENSSVNMSVSVIILIGVLSIILVLLIFVIALYYRNKLRLKKKREKNRFQNNDFHGFHMIRQGPSRGIDDFMQNLAPQWPEPEPNNLDHLETDEEDDDDCHKISKENSAFIKRAGSKNSISSSWSSLFNQLQNNGELHPNIQIKSSKVSFGYK